MISGSRFYDSGSRVLRANRLGGHWVDGVGQTVLELAEKAAACIASSSVRRPPTSM
jgi:hypothetical protein